MSGAPGQPTGKVEGLRARATEVAEAEDINYHPDNPIAIGNWVTNFKLN